MKSKELKRRDMNKKTKSLKITENAKRCSVCGGTVDKHEYCFQCRDCDSFGDFITGIMTPSLNYLMESILKKGNEMTEKEIEKKLKDIEQATERIDNSQAPDYVKITAKMPLEIKTINLKKQLELNV